MLGLSALRGVGALCGLPPLRASSLLVVFRLLVSQLCFRLQLLPRLAGWQHFSKLKAWLSLLQRAALKVLRLFLLSLTPPWAVALVALSPWAWEMQSLVAL